MPDVVRGPQNVPIRSTMRAAAAWLKANHYSWHFLQDGTIIRLIAMAA